jgi:gamma-glutamyltranspeptidase/glutathione hydrolase
MLSAMTPTLVLDRERKLFMILGTPGGPTIINSVYQVIVNVVDHHMSLADAVAAPRIHQQALPDVLFYERGGLGQGTLDGLRAMGYELRERGRMGDIAAIQRTAAGWVGVSDPRRGGGAVGY